MNLFIYSDESGVFDVVHNKYYVYGGLIFLSKEERDEAIRKYKAAEKAISFHYPHGIELKASAISNSDKSKLFRALNSYHKFGVIIDEQRVLPEIFHTKRSKQRYLDYAYKIGLKHAIKQLISRRIIVPKDVEDIHVFVDEHTTATDGHYELEAGLRQEFKEGTFNYQYDIFFKPVFPSMNNLQLKYCNSEKTPLIRGADVIANKLYHLAITDQSVAIRDNLYIKELPKPKIPSL